MKLNCHRADIGPISGRLCFLRGVRERGGGRRRRGEGGRGGRRGRGRGGEEGRRKLKDTRRTSKTSKVDAMIDFMADFASWV